MPSNREIAHELGELYAKELSEDTDTIAGLVDAVQRILDAADRRGFERARKMAAQLHENINPASDQERLWGDPGAGAMGAVLEYRDAILAIPYTPEDDGNE